MNTLSRPMSGYFTLFKCVRNKTLEELEYLIGYREGRLTSKGAQVFGFTRLPKTSEFEVRGYSQLREQDWKSKVAPQRAADLAKNAAAYRALKLPDFDEQQKRNALETMALTGTARPVKVVPFEALEIDFTPDGYVHGAGIPQWILGESVRNENSLLGELIFTAPPGAASTIPMKI